MRALPLIFLATLLATLGCQDKSAPSQAPTLALPVAESIDPLADQASLDVWTRGLHTLDTTKTALHSLRDAVHLLLQTPTQASLSAAREQWHQAHNSVQGFSLFFAMASAHPGLFVQLDSLHNQIDGWPIQPGFLDYFDVYTHSGLVNDISIPVTAKALREAHQQFDDMDRALGLHPIAYLLWGDKGQRPVTDFIKQSPKASGEDEPNSEDLANNRRRALLGLMLELVIDDLEKLHTQWREAGVFAQTYNQLLPQQRSEILRTSSIYLIEQQLISQQLQPQLEAISQPDLEPSAHNLYSGGSRRLLSAQLNSLNHLLAQDKQSWLIEYWSRGASKGWLEQLNAANRVLEKLPLEGAATETHWVAAIAALQQLALPLHAQVEPH